MSRDLIIFLQQVLHLSELVDELSGVAIFKYLSNSSFAFVCTGFRISL